MRYALLFLLRLCIPFCVRIAFLPAHQINDQHFVFDGWVLDVDVHEETIHLRFRQRIRAFLLDRILRRHHHEQRRHLVGGACNRYLPLFHRFEHGRLDFRRCTIDFVAKHNVREYGSGFESKLAFAICLVIHFGPGHVRGQQIRRELDATEVSLEILGQCFDRPGLSKTGQSLNQQIAICQ